MNRRLSSCVIALMMVLAAVLAPQQVFAPPIVFPGGNGEHNPVPDSLTNVFMIISLRTAISGYTGPLIEVTTDYGNGEAFRTNVFATNGWVDEDFLVTYSAGGNLWVSGWYDQSGRTNAGGGVIKLGANVQAAPGEYAPVIVTNGAVVKIGGKPAVATGLRTSLSGWPSMQALWTDDSSSVALDASETNVTHYALFQQAGGVEGYQNLYANNQVYFIARNATNDYWGVYCQADVLSGHAASGQTLAIVYQKNFDYVVFFHNTEPSTFSDTGVAYMAGNSTFFFFTDEGTPGNQNFTGYLQEMAIMRGKQGFATIKTQVNNAWGLW